MERAPGTALFRWNEQETAQSQCQDKGSNRPDMFGLLKLGDQQQAIATCFAKLTMTACNGIEVLQAGARVVV